MQCHTSAAVQEVSHAAHAVQEGVEGRQEDEGEEKQGQQGWADVEGEGVVYSEIWAEVH